MGALDKIAVAKSLTDPDLEPHGADHRETVLAMRDRSSKAWVLLAEALEELTAMEQELTVLREVERTARTYFYELGHVNAQYPECGDARKALGVAKDLRDARNAPRLIRLVGGPLNGRTLPVGVVPWIRWIPREPGDYSPPKRLTEEQIARTSHYVYKGNDNGEIIHYWHEGTL